MYPTPRKTPKKYRLKAKTISSRAKTVKKTVRVPRAILKGIRILSKKPVRRIGGRTRNYNARRTASTSASGFFDVPNSSQSPNVKILDRFAKQGVTMTTEFNGFADWTSEMGVVTVLSMAEEERRIIFTKAILKKWAVKHEMEYDDENKPAFQNGNLRLYYKQTMESDTSVALIWDNVIGPSEPSWLALSNALNAALKIIFVTTDNIFITGLSLERSGASSPYYGQNMILDLRYSTIQFYEKCTVKIQNRTLSQDGDDNAEAVDNVPIYGKILRGNGSNPYYSSAYKGLAVSTVVPFTVSQITGTGLTLPNILLQNSMQEPPSYKRIHSATGESKLHLDPGNIKTMACVYGKTISLNRACKNLYQGFNNPVVGTRNVNSIGLWTQFYMEKMINVDAANPVKIAIESNTAGAAQINLKKVLYTQPYFKKLIEPIII